MDPTTPTITNHAEEKDPPPSIVNSLDRFPAEILLQICGGLPSLDTLWNLMRASPMVWRLFGCYHNTMFESVLSGPYSTTPPKVRKVIRAMVLMRSGQLPFVDLKELLIFMHSLLPTHYLPNELREWMYFHGPKPFYRTFDETKHDLGPGSLSLAQTTAHVARSVVATAYHISALSQSCLSDCLARLRDPSFKPLHPAHCPSDKNIARYHQQLGDPDVVSTTVPLADMGQPAWPEEIRVVRAMWVLQMVGESKYFVEWRAKTICWSHVDVCRLLEESLLRLLYSFGPPVGGDDPSDPTIEVRAAAQYLDTRGEYRRDIYYRLPRAPTPSVDNRWVTGNPRPAESKYQDITPEHRRLLGIPDGLSGWDLIEITLTEPPSCFLFYEQRKYLARQLGYVPFDSFHPLGFAFWERSRVNLFGLVPGSNTRGRLEAACLFAWESILSHAVREIVV